MLVLIESMRTLRAKIVSWGGVAPLSCPAAIGLKIPAQSPTSPTTAVTRVQRRCRRPFMTNTSTSGLRPDIRRLVPRKAWPALERLPQRRCECDREPETQNLPGRGHSTLTAEIGAEGPERLVALIDPNPASLEQRGEERRRERQHHERNRVGTQPAAGEQPPDHQPEEHPAGEVLIRKDSGRQQVVNERQGRYGIDCVVQPLPAHAHALDDDIEGGRTQRNQTERRRRRQDQARSCHHLTADTREIP